MPTSPTTSVIKHLRRAALLCDIARLGDGELLGRFLEGRDEAAFAALVRQHGPMVWGVCRRLLSHHDAEDAFQATFLVLVRKAASILPREMVGNWLYGVAHQTALQSRRAAARRRARELQVKEMPDTEAVQQHRWPDVQPLLDQELSRLPDNYRAVIVLCDLECRTRKEAARRLAVPEGTVAGRLARARAMLAKRLVQRGVSLSGGALAAVLAQNVASAGLPSSVISKTIGVASSFAAGQVAMGPVSVQVATLAEGVLKAMLISKLKASAPVVLVLGLMVTGLGVFTGRMASAQGGQTPVNTRPQSQQEPDMLERQVVLPGQTHKKSHHGGDSKTEQRVAFELRDETWIRVLEKVTDITGLSLLSSIPPPSAKFTHIGSKGRLYSIPEVFEIVNSGLAPYKLKLVHLEKANVLTLAPLQKKSEQGPGALEAHDLLPGQPDKYSPQKEEEKQEKERFTAWGKEVGGLQAGLGYPPGRKRAYSPGETVKLVVRVRNVGKEEIKFQYLKEFFVETPPTVIDDKRKPVLLRGRDAGGLVHVPVHVNLAPGKEIELAELKLDPRVIPQSVHEGQWNLFGTGKFSVQYEQLAHPDTDKVLSKLATGKLELVIKFNSPPAESGEETPEETDRKDANTKPIKIHVYIEKVDVETSTITASCILIGETDNVTKPLRLESLGVSGKAKIMDRGKEVKLTDLKLLPPNTHFCLFIKAYEFGGFEVVRIETFRK